MKSIPALLSVSLLASSVAAPAGSGTAPPDLADAVEAFTLDVYRGAGEAGNLVLSPYSIHTVMLMALAGAEGPTRDELAAGLRVAGRAAVHDDARRLREGLADAAARGDIELRIAQSLWPDNALPLQPGFVEIMAGAYASDIETVDYRTDADAARRRINAWVGQETRDKIPELLKPGSLDARTRLVLVNAVYFKGQWEDAFDPRMTLDRRFTPSHGDPANVPMMHRTGLYRHASLDGVAALELPYRNRTMSMLVLLPDESSSAAELDANLSPDLLDRIEAALVRREVRVALPKFKLRTNLICTRLLAGLGMPTAFQAGAADFSGINGKAGDLYISEVVHEAFIEVNEEGTEAAAATGAIMRTTAFRPDEPAAFIADRPFVYLVRDHATGAILFMGRVADPG